MRSGCNIMPVPPIPQIAVLVTCFNRREQTLLALRALDDAAADRCRVNIVLVDDGSTDDTGDAVRQAFPSATVVQGDGKLFWNGGMRRAWQAAIPAQPDFFLWLNDDTVLRPGAISDLISTYRTAGYERTIVVGCTSDPTTGEITYGGYRRAKGSLSRLRFVRLHGDDVECDTMNGNCVLFPVRVTQDVGINSEHYRHAFGDNDYGLSASRAGYRIVQLRAPVAVQARNTKYDEATSGITLSNWRHVLFGPKGVPVGEWLHFCIVHGGPLWPVNFIFRYLKMIWHGVRG